MSIASEITRINTNIANSYTACNNKGATMPQTQNSANLATTIASIPSGSTINNQDKTVTTNGTYTADSGYTGLGTVTVNVDLNTNLDKACENTLTDFTSNTTSVKEYTFYGGTRLTNVKLPNVTEILTNAFRGCNAVTVADFGTENVNTTLSFAAQSLRNTSSLQKLIIRYNAVATLADSTSLQGSGIASEIGYVYVPDALVSSYQSASNWSTYSARIKGLSELP